MAEGLEWSYGWSPVAAQRLRFVLDFAYATGLRAGELVGSRLGAVETDVSGDHWLHVVGKGAKAGKVVMPLLARSALDRYMMQRGLPVTPAKWDPTTPILGSLDNEDGISATRLWSVMKRFFATAAEVNGKASPATAEKLRRATPHWTRHTHATHALESGAELTTLHIHTLNVQTAVMQAAAAAAFRSASDKAAALAITLGRTVREFRLARWLRLGEHGLTALLASALNRRSNPRTASLVIASNRRRGVLTATMSGCVFQRSWPAISV